MAELTYPNRVNTQGYPSLSGKPRFETVSGVETLIIEFNPHLALNADWAGAFWVFITEPITVTGQGPQPVVFTTRGEQGSTPLYRYSGSQVTAGELITGKGGVLQCFYNSDTKRLQLIALI